MNHYFYETRGRERVNELMAEGMRSQAVRRSGGPERGRRSGLPRAILALVGLLGLLGLLVR